jgi:hypothetical protein
MRSNLKPWALALLISVAVPALAMAALIGLAVWAPQDQKVIHAHLADAIASGVINEKVALGVLDAHPTPVYASDCLLFTMMAAPAAGTLPDVLGNTRGESDSQVIDPRVPPYPSCQHLIRAFSEFETDGSDRLRYFPYDNYILGMKTLGRVLLSIMPLRTMSLALLSVTYGLLAAVVLVALFFFRRARDAAARSRALGFLVIAACFALFYGLSHFGRTLFFAPLDGVHFLFILIALIVPLGGMGLPSLALYAAAYGSCVAIFEFLTGGIPLALALMPVLLALGFRKEGRIYIQGLVTLWSGFSLAVAACFAIKKILALSFLPAADVFFGPLLNRMYGDAMIPPAMGSLKYMIEAYAFWSRLVAGGSSNLGKLLVIAALCTVIAVTWQNRKTLWSFHRPLIPASLLGLLVFVAWFAVFFNHAIMHPFFMARLLVIPILVAATLAATEVTNEP